MSKKSIDIPHLEIVGDSDGCIHPDMFQQGQEADVTNSKVVVIEKAGHFVQHDQPGKINELLMNWFK